METLWLRFSFLERPSLAVENVKHLISEAQTSVSVYLTLSFSENDNLMWSS